MSYHYLNFIDDVEDDREWVVDDEEDEEDEEVVIKINKRLIPRDYTFYKIYKNGCENYVGSTVNLYNRKKLHKNCCNDEKSKKYNLPVYKYIRANGGYDSFCYEILDKRFCCKVDAEIYEAELMKIHNATLNVHRNYSEEDKKEYNKQKLKNYRKKYPDYNKQKCKEYRKKNPEYNKQKCKEYREKKKQITINITINLPQN